MTPRDGSQNADYPLAEAAGAVARWWAVPVAAALVCALVAGGIDALRPPLYESHTVWQVNPLGEVDALVAQLSLGLWTLSPSSRHGDIERTAESLVQLMSNQILEKDQTLSQYATSYRANVFARLAGSDAVVKELMAREGEAIRRSWPQAAQDANVLRERAIRVTRSKPESIVELSFRASDAETARRASESLAGVLIEADTAERNQRRETLLQEADRQLGAASEAAEEWTSGTAARFQTSGKDGAAEKSQLAYDAALGRFRDALDTQQRLANAGGVLSEPVIALIQAASVADRVSPNPMQTALRAAIGGLLAALLLVAVFGTASRRKA